MGAIANPEHLAILKQGVEAWNRWRKEHPEIRADLSKADLTGVRLTEYPDDDLLRMQVTSVNLSGVDLFNANLAGVYLLRATLINADLAGANLIKTDLTNADLTRATLTHAALTGATLTGADLTEAHLTGATLTNADLTRAEIIRVRLVSADLRLADLRLTNFSMADLRGVDLQGAILVGTNFEGANLTGSQVYGISAWDVNLVGTHQADLIVTRYGEPVITVDNLEVAQFIYLLHSEKIRHVIETVTSKAVLILGRFTPERKAVLDAIWEELRKHDYVPVVFDFDKPASRDTHETITTLARMARFVIADITEPRSIPQELVSIVETLPSVPVKPILKRGCEPWCVFR